MNFDTSRALELLRRGSGDGEAVFRDGQEAAIRHVVEGRGRLLVVQKTGWGKSFVYFIATRLLRDAGHGPALLVSPLLALMRNQIAAAERMGVRATRIASDNQDRWEEVERELARNTVDVLLISPERLANERFVEQVLAPIAGRISLLVIDEAHCISDWGHDFRPDYRRIERIVRTLPPNLRVLATTATANNRVLEDLRAVLGPDLAISRGDLNRPSLVLQSIRLPSQAARLAWLAEQVPSLPGSGIIYALTVRDAELVAAWLRSRGMNVESYTGQTGERRETLETALLENRVKALVATTALGMGYDKPDLGFVVHYQTPGSVVAYYQQVGRAGRALEAAYGVLLSGEEDTVITDYFINTAFPSQEEVEAILGALDAAPNGLSLNELLVRVNIRRTRVDNALKLLALESPAPIAQQNGRWQLTAAPLDESFWQRAERLTALRRREQCEMQSYVALTGDHMAFLIRALDADATRVTPPRLPPMPTVPGETTVRSAIEYLRRTSLPVEPRKQWPAEGLPGYCLRGRIPEALRPQAGKALCVWGDAGWGGLVSQGKYRDQRFADELVDACAELVRRWQPQPAPRWISCVPSRRRPELVPDFARRLADALGLPFVPTLIQTRDRPEQKNMANSAQQARNLDGSLAVASAQLPEGPVLLVDDMVDSRWTLTLCAWLLRSHGSSEVWPLVLADAGAGAGNE